VKVSRNEFLGLETLWICLDSESTKWKFAAGFAAMSPD
jgi:hypothetical protein